jgi:RIP metalloprotease RseP
VPRHDAAAFNVLQKGDVITAINGRPITKSVPSAAEAEKGINTLISSIRGTPEGESIKLTITHPSSNYPSEVVLKPSKAPGKASATIGVLLSPNFVKAEIMKTDNIPQAARYAAEYTVELTKATASGITSVFGDFFTGKADSAPQVSGPIGLVRTGTAIVATQSWTSVLLFAAAVSINLGVVNALPFPALDGGQLLFVLSEAVTGKKVDQRVQEGVTGAALLFLLLFSARAAIGDIGSIFGI